MRESGDLTPLWNRHSEKPAAVVPVVVINFVRCLNRSPPNQ
jgi:hypothetical protein